MICIIPWWYITCTIHKLKFYVLHFTIYSSSRKDVWGAKWNAEVSHFLINQNKLSIFLSSMLHVTVTTFLGWYCILWGSQVSKRGWSEIPKFPNLSHVVTQIEIEIGGINWKYHLFPTNAMIHEGPYTGVEHAPTLRERIAFNN